MKVRLDADEWWPVYIPDSEYGTLYEVSDELWERYIKTMSEFQKARVELRKIVGNQ